MERTQYKDTLERTIKAWITLGCVRDSRNLETAFLVTYMCNPSFHPRRISVELGLEIVTGRAERLRTADEKAKALATILDRVGGGKADVVSEHCFAFSFKVSLEFTQ